MTCPIADDDQTVDFGRLANNFILVQSLQTALSRAEMNANTIPKLVSRIIRDEAWTEWVIPDTEQVIGWKDPKTRRVNPADFREFIRSPRPRGCDCPVHVFERMVRDTPAWEVYEDLLRGKPGAPDGNQYNPEGHNQWTNRDDITVSPDSPDTIPLAPRSRDYTREAPTGTSVSYLNRRLSKEAPELYKRVQAGELSTHAAGIEAGFVEAKIKIPHDPVRAARILVKHLTADQVRALIAALATAGTD